MGKNGDAPVVRQQRRWLLEGETRIPDPRLALGDKRVTGLARGRGGMQSAKRIRAKGRCGGVQVCSRGVGEVEGEGEVVEGCSDGGW